MRTLCYVASPSYSGSTLLTFLLGTHPQIATVGELKGRLYAGVEVPRRCSCGRDVLACPFWATVAEGLTARGVPCDLRDLDTYFHDPRHPVVDRLLRARTRGKAFEALRAAALRLWPGARRELVRLQARNRAAADVVCETQGGQLLLDSSKDAIRLQWLATSGLFDLRVIHLVRDGRGTANSYRKRDGFDVAAGAARWRRAHESYARIFRRLAPGTVHRMRYEDLASDPLATLHAALDFLSLPHDGLRLDFMECEHHVFGNPMRLSGSGEISADESWRDDLDPEALRRFDRVAGDLNRQLGYGGPGR